MKFMAIRCYAYMKLKMPGPNGVITMSGDPKKALEAEVASLELVEAKIATSNDIEVSTNTNEVATAAPKKPHPDDKGPAAPVAPTDLSSSNWATPASAG